MDINEIEINEELIAEVLRIWSACMVMGEGSPEEAAEASIIDVLSAVRDGKQKLPGEGKRFDRRAIRDSVEDDLQFEFELWKWALTAMREGAHLLIALRPEKGGR